MPDKLLLTFNAGSSSLKLGLFEASADGPRRVGKGVIDLRHDPAVFRLTEGPDTFEEPLQAARRDDHLGLVRETLDRLGAHFDLSRVAFAGHRVVHGGLTFSGPAKITEDAIGEIEALVPLAPLHQPQALRFIRAMRELYPDIRQSASFDTAFHASGDERAKWLALPAALHEEGVRRYGFHGLSYAFIAKALKARGVLRKKTVVAHLGSGASLCGLLDGISRDCSMGFSTLDGVPMATRPGWLDPGVLLYLQKERGMSVDALEDLLYHRSGLLGLSGRSADTRDLLEDKDPAAELAISVFVFRVAGEVARLASSLGGIDALVFTAGIGEHQPRIRAGIVERLAWIGAELDSGANETNGFSISGGGSRISIHVMETDEEQVIAEEALDILDR